MKVKTFHALTMQDAIRAIKEELGPDAVILSSKEVRQGGHLLSYFNKPVLEVMAAAEHDPLPPIQSQKAPEPPPPLTPMVPAASHEAFHETLQGMLAKPAVTPSPASTGWVMPKSPATVGSAPESSAKARPIKRTRLLELRKELQDLSRELTASLPVETQSLGHHGTPAVATLCRNLVGQGLRPSTAERLGSSLTQFLADRSNATQEEVHTALGSRLTQDIRVSGPLLAGRGDRTIAVMIGTNGAGKTACITKLAAHYQLEEKKSVAIVTLDTYRLASVEQLRMYADVLGIPCESALSAKQAVDAIRRQSEADLILIDTAGLGEADVSLVHELHHMLKDDSEVQTHLVMSASTREQDLHRQVARVQTLPLLRLLFTKLDETESFGTIYELSHHTGIPLSYWSAGQRVPDDLELATPDRLAEFLVSRRYAAPFPATGDSAAGWHPAHTLTSITTGSVTR
ncbi:MAG: flagellar biosynthesis protein FlhF [Nitrospira sp.]